VRLVKGGYRERPDVVYRRQDEIDAAFERDIERLLRGGRYPAIATHDVKAIRVVRTVAHEIGLDQSQFEFQMLYGVRADLQAALAREGYTVRCYVPYGADWYGWLLRCLRRIPSGAVRGIVDRVRGRQALV
jgi:proline dehydrogenase